MFIFVARSARLVLAEEGTRSSPAPPFAPPLAPTFGIGPTADPPLLDARRRLAAPATIVETSQQRQPPSFSTRHLSKTLAVEPHNIYTDIRQRPPLRPRHARTAVPLKSRRFELVAPRHARRHRVAGPAACLAAATPPSPTSKGLLFIPRCSGLYPASRAFGCGLGGQLPRVRGEIITGSLNCNSAAGPGQRRGRAASGLTQTRRTLSRAGPGAAAVTV